ncbi:preprotein translocase subunit YajC [Citricoccus alkalitolerans]|uniref:Preprotein translocase subunit YajC n=1 Tax=Citricoccus alkalitolerans TaxID=246603 RepID=A0ABV8XYV4_9MICC
MTQLIAPATASLVAEGANPEGGGGLPFDPFLLIMLAIFALLIFSMFRRSKKAQQQQQQLHQSLGPGVEVMTTMGLFGTILSVDKDENKAVIEISPGNTATVHLQAIGKAVDPAAGAAGTSVGGEPETTVPDSPAGLEEANGGTDRNNETDGNGPDDQRPGTDRPSA